jgi:opacity protein-like surface antigen
MNMHKSVILLLTVLLVLSLPGLLSAQRDTAKFQFHLFGGLNRVLDYGCYCDYELGINDFPQTPPHTTSVIGMGVGYMLSPGFGLELDGRYYGTTEISLTDPSDSDTVTVDSAKHWSITLNVMYKLLKGSIQPYVLGGAGFDTLIDRDVQFYETDQGYMFELAAPEKHTHFMWNLAGGVDFKIGRTFGLRLEARYVNIPESGNQPTIPSFNGTAGITARF